MKPSKAFDAFLQGEKTLPIDPEERELARLLMEVAETDVPDPGPDYWLNYNQRLNQKLAVLPPRRKSVFRRFTWLGSFALAAGLALVFLIQPQGQTTTPQLEALNESSLAVLATLTDSSEPFFAEAPSDDLEFQLESGEVELLDSTTLFEEY